jgi:FixJ family two-component response regulator
MLARPDSTAASEEELTEPIDNNRDRAQRLRDLVSVFAPTTVDQQNALAEMLRIADEMERDTPPESQFRAALANSVASRLCVKQAAALINVSDRTVTRHASNFGVRVKGQWSIDPQRMREFFARRDASHATPNTISQDGD